MKVLVLNTMAPFVWGGAEELAEHLVRNLLLRDIDAELFRIPFRWEPYGAIASEIARFKAMRLPNVDRVISLKFPAYLIPSDRHTTWLVHQYRQAYELWDTPYCNIPHDERGAELRDLIHSADNGYFHRQENIFTISAEVSRRLSDYNGVSAKPLRAPLNDPELFTGGPHSPYILAPGRINGAKRQWLLVEAMRHLPSSAKLIVAGPPETPADAEDLQRRVEEYGLADRVKLDMRFLSRSEIASYVNNAAGIAYLPYGEDSYSYVVMEAFEAGKPVVTSRDAGELLDIIIDEKTGLVTDPDPEALAARMANLLYYKEQAMDMGAEARKLWRSAGISWDHTIETLLGASR